MKRSPLVLLFSVSLLLAACGGGGGGGSAPLPSGGSGTVGVGGSTATPSPTPTPTPVPSGATALSGPATYRSGGPWGPPGVARALDFPVQHGYDGSGQTVAVVIDSDVVRSDLSSFFSYFQIPRSTSSITTVVMPSASPGPNGGIKGSQGEATLDVETIAGLSPGAAIRIYQVPDLGDQSIADAYNQIVSDKVANVVNSSFGGCEYTSTGITTADTAMANGAANGVAFVASSGDNGNECYTGATPQYTPGASWPASNPNVTGVGGTQTDDAQLQSLTNPQVWNSSSGAGSGGISGTYKIPAFQTSGVLGNCLAAASGSPCSTTYRNVPDVSMPAVDVAVYLSGWNAMDGTSWSSPEYAALLAQLYEYCNSPAGIKNPVTIPYYVFGQTAADFIDVIGGNDQWSGTTPFYSTTAGYDDASGLGVPKGWAFAQTACPGRTPASGLIARSAMSTFTATAPRPAEDTTLDVTPRVAGLVDEGVRDASAPTRIQIALDPSSDVATGEARIVSELQDAGFTIVRRFSNHLLVDAVGPSADVNRLFRTQLHDVAQNGYGTRYMPSTQIVVPASIAQYTAAVSLDNVVKYHPALR